MAKYPKPKPINLTATVLKSEYDGQYSRGLFSARSYGFSKLNEIVNEWFNENQIWKLDFKSKTWSRLSSLVSGLEAKAIAAAVTEFTNAKPEYVTAKFSHTAGCQCGCSPGFMIRGAFARRFDIEFKVSDEDINSLKEILPAYKIALDAEIAANTTL